MLYNEDSLTKIRNLSSTDADRVRGSTHVRRRRVELDEPTRMLLVVHTRGEHMRARGSESIDYMWQTRSPLIDRCKYMAISNRAYRRV